jgi:hypothetical protein
MTRVRLRVAVAFAASALVAAGAAVAATPPIGSLPAGWSHAEINVMVKGKPHTFILDRGRVQSLSSSVVVLRERDGSVVTVPVNARTRVRINGQLATLADVQPGSLVQTLRIDGGAAKQLRVLAPPRTRR